MTRSKSLIWPICALFLAGIGWGTTGIFVRVLSERGFGSFELLIFRLLVAGALLLPGYLVWLMSQRVNSVELMHQHGFYKRTTLVVALSMVLYYLGAIVAVRNLPLILAVLLIGSSPILAWTWPLLREGRGPRTHESRQGIGVLIAILGLLGFVFSKSPQTEVVHLFTLEAVPALGFAGGILSAAVTVMNSRILKTAGNTGPSPIAISILTATIGLALAPFVLVYDTGAGVDYAETVASVTKKVRSHFELIVGFGILATLIPGLAQAYASKRLPPVVSSTVTIQLQLWTAVFGWLILNEKPNGLQFFSAVLVVVGTFVCLLGDRPIRLK